MAYINGRDMVLEIDGKDVSDQSTTWSLGYGSRQSFADMRGSVPKVLTGTIFQQLDADSLYQQLLAPDMTPKAATLKPLGNTDPSEAAPHYTFNVQVFGISGDTFMGGDADSDPSKSLTVDVTWLIDSWTAVTTPPSTPTSTS